MKVERIGYHVKAPILENVVTDYQRGIRDFQLFISSPKSYSPIDLSTFAVLVRMFPDASFTVHGPFWACLCKPLNVKMVQNTFDYYVKLSHELSKLGSFRIVTHVGGRGEYSKQESALSILNFCRHWLLATKDDTTILCLENDSGSKSDTKMGFVKVLNKICDVCGSPRVKMCFDSEHAYANGVDLADVDFLEYIKHNVSIVHFNAIPSNVSFGGHLDRHSKTPINESKDGWSYLRTVYDVFYNGAIPFIREIESSYILYEDLEFLNREGDIIEVEYTEIRGDDGD